MSLSISHRCMNIAPSLTLAIDSRAKEMAASGLDVIGFGAGEPDFPTPKHICDAAKEALDMGMTRYTPVPGTMELRMAITRKMERDHGLTYSPQEIIVSNGAKHSLFTIFQTILDPGDEVLIPTPCWVSYPELVRMAGGVPVFVPTNEETASSPATGISLPASPGARRRSSSPPPRTRTVRSGAGSSCSSSATWRSPTPSISSATRFMRSCFTTDGSTCPLPSWASRSRTTPSSSTASARPTR